MLGIFPVRTDRSDITPLEPVCRELEARGHHLTWSYYEADLALVLGDRLDALRVVCDLTETRVPIAHIHGGETTFGSYDNQIRDAITRLSHIHFTAAEAYRNKVISLGERWDRVHTVGAPGLDNLTDLPDRVPGPYFVCTYHPATLEAESGIHALLEALDRFDYEQIWTSVNRDPGWREISGALGDRQRSLNPREYHLMCRHASAVIGNSSSGLIEAPYLGVPTVNVGRRQDGRLMGPSVFSCEEHPDSIERAIRKALEYDGPFDNPYGKPGASRQIADVIEGIDPRDFLVKR